MLAKSRLAWVVQCIKSHHNERCIEIRSGEESVEASHRLYVDGQSSLRRQFKIYFTAPCAGISMRYLFSAFPPQLLFSLFP